jgi:hypothetical protein
MPMGDRGHVAVMDYSDEDDIRRGENDDMDDLEEDESDEEESDNDDDEEDENDDGIASDEEEEEEEVHDESVHKFIRTFHNGDYDQEFDDALSSDRSAVVPNTRPTQASYNKPDNWVERNRIGLEKVKEQLQDYIDQLSYDNGFYLNLTHNGQGDQLMDNEEPIVWHEPVLDMYWDILEAKIDRVRQLGVVTDIERIQIENVEMKKERLDALVDIFRSGRATNSYTYITFTNTNLCGEGIVWLSKLVEFSSQLQYLFLYHNRIDNTESVCCLSRSLKLHACITRLYLTHCDLGSSPEILFVILQSDVKYIDLGNNNIGSLGAVKIAEYLESDPPIEVLSLGHNRLNDDDAILISRALKRNTNLMGINLLRNNITSMGVKALLTCVFDSSSLNAISESNHTLRGMNFFLQDDELEDCIDRMLELDRTEKIVLALQDKDSLLKYLANVPVELIPAVLAFPLRRIDNEHQHEHLNIVYSTMRWWNMPMLYSYLNCVRSDTKRKRDK